MHLQLHCQQIVSRRSCTTWTYLNEFMVTHVSCSLFVFHSRVQMLATKTLFSDTTTNLRGCLIYFYMLQLHRDSLALTICLLRRFLSVVNSWLCSCFIRNVVFLMSGYLGAQITSQKYLGVYQTQTRVHPTIRWGLFKHATCLWMQVLSWHQGMCGRHSVWVFVSDCWVFSLTRWIFPTSDRNSGSDWYRLNSQI